MPTTNDAAEAAKAADSAAPKAAPVVAHDGGPPPPADRPPGHVHVRVMKKGHLRIFTGDTAVNDVEKFPTFRWGDETTMPRATAEKYEDDGMVEIQDGGASARSRPQSED